MDQFRESEAPVNAVSPFQPSAFLPSLARGTSTGHNHWEESGCQGMASALSVAPGVPETGMGVFPEESHVGLQSQGTRHPSTTLD